MNHAIKTLPETRLIGMSKSMSLAKNQTGDLWRAFGPHIKSINNRLNHNKISLQIYPDNYFSSFEPLKEFINWAAVEVSDFTKMPEGLESFTIPSGEYAVFHYKGPAGDPAIFQYIFQKWLPNSGYRLDSRPHFEVLGEKYSNTDAGSEEEIWIPLILD